MSSIALAPTEALRSTDLLPGALFADRYAVVAQLGEGGMGAVYRVVDRELDETVALKALRKEVAEAEGALDRFRREVKLARRVTHPNVARTFDLGSHVGMRFLTMELIDGEPLSRSVDKRVALAEALRIATEIARGLVAAHTVGVVHRDLKPDNVMLAGTRVAITDFGIARQTGVGDASGTMGLLLGTPAYMAPEQVEGRELDGRADVYALGVVLFQMLTGRLPFVGDTPFAIAAARLQGDPPDPRLLDRHLPDPIAELVRFSMARRRDARPDAHALLQRLDELRGGRAVEIAAPALSTPTPRAKGPTTVAIVPFTGEGGASMTEAVADALCAVRGVRVESPGRVGAAARDHMVEGVVDPSALARALGVQWVLSGSVRRAGDIARVATRLCDRDGAQAWADRVEMPFDAFKIEDRVVTRAIDAIKSRMGHASAAMPADPAAAELYRRAREAYLEFSPASSDRAVELLEEAHARHPDEPLLVSGLAAALVRQWMFSNNPIDRERVLRAEELSLRALEADPHRAEALVTIGIIRWQFGELAEAARAFEEAIARNPMLADAHDYLGQMLGEAGHVSEALRHLDTALRLDPNTASADTERMRLLALTGDPQARARVDTFEERPPLRFEQDVFRQLVWARDLARIEAFSARVRQLSKKEQDYYLPMIESTIRRMRGERVPNVFRTLADAPHASIRRRSFFHQIAAETFMLDDSREEALDSIERASGLLLFDVLWLDKCPLFAYLRDDPRFARVRAIASARAASIFR